MDVIADLPADAQPAEPVQQGQGLLDDPAVCAQPGAVFGAAPGDDRGDAFLPDLGAVFVVVIAAVGIDRCRSPPTPCSGYLQLAMLVFLIVVPKASATTRRFSLAMGTRGARCGPQVLS